MTKTRTKNEAPLHKYFTMMLNMADDELDPFQYRLLAHYIRWSEGSNYEESIRTAAKATRMSANKIQATLDDLVELGYLKVKRPTTEQARKGATIQITVIDRWAENIKRYSGVSEMTLDSAKAVSEMTQQNEKPVSNMIRLEEQDTEEHLNTSDANASEVADTTKKDRSNPNFDAVCEYVFKTNPKDVGGDGGRIGAIAAWLNGKSDGMKRAGQGRLYKQTSRTQAHTTICSVLDSKIP